LYIKREGVGIDPASWLRSNQDRITESLLDSRTKLQKNPLIYPRHSSSISQASTSDPQLEYCIQYNGPHSRPPRKSTIISIEWPFTASQARYYEMVPKEETISHTFINLMGNIGKDIISMEKIM